MFRLTRWDRDFTLSLIRNGYTVLMSPAFAREMNEAARMGDAYPYRQERAV